MYKKLLTVIILIILAGCSDSDPVPVFPGNVYDLDTMPEPIGGISGMLEKLIYPAEARAKNIEGRVLIQVVVTEKGKSARTIVKEGIGYGCDEEAARVVKLTEWKPATKDDQAVMSQVVVPIIFRLGE